MYYDIAPNAFRLENNQYRPIRSYLHFDRWRQRYRGVTVSNNAGRECRMDGRKFENFVMITRVYNDATQFPQCFTASQLLRRRDTPRCPIAKHRVCCETLCRWVLFVVSFRNCRNNREQTHHHSSVAAKADIYCISFRCLQITDHRLFSFVSSSKYR